MNVKRIGFLTGAAIAGVGVWAFYALTTVTDDDRLAEVLEDHCLPYVTTGVEPFTEMGRTPGVYDEVQPRDGLEDGGTKILHGNRFIAQWGIQTGNGNTVRLCFVDPSYADNTIAAFDVTEDGFVSRMTRLFSTFDDLAPDRDVIESGPTVMGWFGMDRAPNEGLRVVMTVSPGLVSGVLVGADLN
ncbi:MAG: hypothetical protein AAGL89_14185 [Pseudomonadota bacterium]